LADHRSFTLVEIYDIIYLLFGDFDRYVDINFILSRLTEEAAELVDHTLTLNSDRLKNELPDILAWIIGLIINLQENYPGFKQYTTYDQLLEEIVQKYLSNPPAPKPFQVNLTGIRKPNLNVSLSDWQKYFNTLYGEINDLLPPTLLLDNLLKDIGSLVKYLRERYERKYILRKIGSVIAWTFALANKFNIDLSYYFYRKYGYKYDIITREPERIYELQDRLFMKFKSDIVMLIYSNNINIDDLIIKLSRINEDYMSERIMIYEIGDHNEIIHQENLVITKINLSPLNVHKIIKPINISTKIIYLLNNFDDYSRLILSAILSSDRYMLNYRRESILLRPMIYIYTSNEDVIEKIYSWICKRDQDINTSIEDIIREIKRCTNKMLNIKHYSTTSERDVDIIKLIHCNIFKKCNSLDFILSNI